MASRSPVAFKFLKAGPYYGGPDEIDSEIYYSILNRVTSPIMRKRIIREMELLSS
jgi:DNA polymerase III delta prime subunit